MHQPLDTHWKAVSICNNIIVLMATSPVFHTRSKHIELDLFYVREKVLKKEILVFHIILESQIADVLTKALSNTRFCSLRNKLKVQNFAKEA